MRRRHAPAVEHDRGREVAGPLLDEGQEVGVGDLLLEVGQRDRLAVEDVEGVAGDVDAEVVELLLEPLAPGQLADRQLAAREPHRLGRHDLVRQRVLDDAVLVDPALVGERVRPDDGLVRLDREAGQVADEAAGRRDVLGRHAGGELGELRRPRPEGHDDLLERRVAGALAEAVDRDLDLARPGLDGGERVGRGEAEVVVAVDGDRRVPPDEVDDAADEGPELGRDRVADGVGDVDRGGPGADDRLVDLEEELGVGPGGVLGRELDLGVAAELLAAVADPADGLGEGLLAGQLELVLEVDVGGRDEDVEVGALGDLDRLDRLLGVAVAAAGEGGDRDALGLLGDPVDGLPVARRGGREAGLDDVHLEADELAGDLELLGGGQAGAGRLLAVAEGGVEDADGAGGDERAGGYGYGHQ